jgi:hypothetical protein
MEMAIREAGWWRILLASAAGAFDRMSGLSGHFYRVAGRRVAAIDGPGPETIAPYNAYIVLAPRRADELVRELARRLSGATLAVADVNDVGSEVLAASGPVPRRQIGRLMDDNPMGQGRQRTPVAVLRPSGRAPESAPWPAVPKQAAAALEAWPGVGQFDPAGSDLSWVD